MRFAPALLLAAVAACTSSAPPPPQPSPTPGLLIEKRGVVMTPAQARQSIGFVPVVPPGTVIATAVIPPLGAVRNRSTNGLAMEYRHGGAVLVLSQWPRAGFTISAGDSDVTHSPCAPIVLSAPAGSSYLWTNRSGLVLTLQPDGAASGSLLASEVRRLLAVSRCRKARTLRSSRLRLPLTALWRRQSAS